MRELNRGHSDGLELEVTGVKCEHSYRHVHHTLIKCAILTLLYMSQGEENM
jgi:hypothetical protein